MLDESIEDPQDLVVGYDAAALVNHPDKSKDAKELRTLGAVTLEAVREATGFDDNDAIDWESDDPKAEFDRQVWLAQTFNDSQLLPESIRPEPPAAPMVPGQEDEPTGDPQSKEIPERDESKEGEQQQQDNEQDRIAAASVLASAALTARRARELAGSRLRSRVNGQHKDTPNTDLAAVLGRETVERMGLTAAGLVDTASDLFTRHLVEEGIEPKVADKLGEMVEQYAAQTLFDEMSRLPNTFGSYVRRVI